MFAIYTVKRSDGFGLVVTFLVTLLCFNSAASGQGGPDPANLERWLETLPVWRSSQLGFDYQLAHYVHFQCGAIVARVSSPPIPGSPASIIRSNETGELITLEPGDLVIAMDDMVFFSRADFDDHKGETTIYFRDSRTGRLGVGKTMLPAEVTPSQLVKGDSRLEPKVIVPWSSNDRSPFAANQAELRGLLLQSIQDGEVKLGIPKVRDANGTFARSWFPSHTFSGPAHPTVYEQALVESLRFDLGDPVLNQTLAAALPNVERLIDRQLALLKQNQAEQLGKERLDQQIEFQYLYAVFAAAAARGQSIPPFTPLAVPAPAPAAYFVRLLSQRNASEILYMPRLNWWIITRSQHRQPQAPEWSTCKTGEEIGMMGYYAYIAKYADGSADPPREDLHITQKGDWKLP